MTTQELHINLDILLQKVSSNWNKDFLPQEKDILINREILKFIKQRFNPRSNSKQLGAFDTIKRVQDTNALYKTVTLPVININQKEVGIRLPFDFLFDISSEVEVTPSCNTDNVLLNDLTYYTKKITTLSDIAGVTEVTIDIIIGATTTRLFELTTLPSNYLPQDNIEDYKKAFIYNNAIIGQIDRLLPLGVEAKFNKYNNTIEFESSIAFSVEYKINAINQTVETMNNVFKVPNVTKSLTASIRIVDEEFKTDINNSYLSNSKDNNVVGYLRESIILLQKLENGIMSSATLTYIAKPKPIDLLLGYNSNMSDSNLEEIISNTAESIKAITSSDTYDKFRQDNLLIE